MTQNQRPRDGSHTEAAADKARNTAGHAPGSGAADAPSQPPNPLDSKQLIENPRSSTHMADDPMAGELADDPMPDDPLTRDRSPRP
ncbi:hypothetical protein V3C33_05980 [Micrococcaceae bacterium Sec5.7]